MLELLIYLIIVIAILIFYAYVVWLISKSIAQDKIEALKIDIDSKNLATDDFMKKEISDKRRTSKKLKHLEKEYKKLKKLNEKMKQTGRKNRYKRK